MSVGTISSLSESEYHADPAPVPSLSASLAKILCSESPLHCWTAHPRLNPNFVREERELFDLGTVAHALMLQGLSIGHIIQATKKEGSGKNRIDTGELVEDFKTKEAREERDAVRAMGKIPILAKHWDRIQGMVLAGKAQIAAHKEASDVFTDAGKAEQSMVWEDDHGVICRSRMDWHRKDFRRIADYKSTGTSVNPEFISKYALAQGWDIQAAFYLRGLKKLTGEDAEFLFVAQEDSQPHALAVFGMGPDFLWAGEQKVQAAIDLWAKCIGSGKWSCYSDRIVCPVLPSYEETRITEKQMRDAS